MLANRIGFRIGSNRCINGVRSALYIRAVSNTSHIKSALVAPLHPQHASAKSHIQNRSKVSVASSVASFSLLKSVDHINIRGQQQQHHKATSSFFTSSLIRRNNSSSANNNNNNNNNILSILKERGLIYQQTDAAENILGAGSKGPVGVYAGFDPTADGLHVGNLLVLVVMKHFLNAGHRVVALVGGGTGRIGDPSGKQTERQLLSVDRVDANARAIREEIHRILGGGSTENNGGNVEVVDNADWLCGLSALTLLRDVGKFFRVNSMVKLESIRSRLESSEGITYTEFSYALLQAFDFLHLYNTKQVVCQIGGSDQWGNIVSGLELIRRSVTSAQEASGAGAEAEEAASHVACGVTLPLLVTASGKKFGKSEGNAVWLNPNKTSCYDFYQFFMRTEDADVGKLLRLLTFLPLDRILEIEAEHAKVPENRVAQRALAREVTRMIHGEQGLDQAEAATRLLFGGSSAATGGSGEANWEQLGFETIRTLLKDAPSVTLPISSLLINNNNNNNNSGATSTNTIAHICKEARIVKSLGEARRLIQGGGLYVNNRRVDSHDFKVFATEEDQQKQQQQQQQQQSSNSVVLIDGKLLVLRTGKKNYHLVQFA